MGQGGANDIGCNPHQCVVSSQICGSCGGNIQTAAVKTDIEAEIVPLIHIKSGTEKPADPFIEVQYENYWYWIDATDFASKRVFSFLMLILMLAETGEGGKLPVLTIPAG